MFMRIDLEYNSSNRDNRLPVYSTRLPAEPGSSPGEKLQRKVTTQGTFLSLGGFATGSSKHKNIDVAHTICVSSPLYGTTNVSIGYITYWQS